MYEQRKHNRNNIPNGILLKCNSPVLVFSMEASRMRKVELKKIEYVPLDLAIIYTPSFGK
jgi:hypothetical protein